MEFGDLFSCGVTLISESSAGTCTFISLIKLQEKTWEPCFLGHFACRVPNCQGSASEVFSYGISNEEDGKGAGTFLCLSLGLGGLLSCQELSGCISPVLELWEAEKLAAATRMVPTLGGSSLLFSLWSETRHLPLLLVIDYFLCCAEAFQFNTILCVYFHILLPILLVSYPKHHRLTSVQKLFPYVLF